MEFSKKTFNNFDYSRNIQTINAYTVAKNFNNIEKQRNNSIMLMGYGKIHLCLAIANKLMNDGVSVLYMDYREVVTRLK